MVGITPRRSGPLIGARAAVAASTTASSACSAARPRSTRSRPSGREHDVLAGGAVQDRRVELPLQHQDAGRQGGLGYRAGQGGAAEMAALGQGDEVAELLRAGQGDHRIIRSNFAE